MVQQTPLCAEWLRPKDKKTREWDQKWHLLLLYCSVFVFYFMCIGPHIIQVCVFIILREPCCQHERPAKPFSQIWQFNKAWAIGSQLNWRHSEIQKWHRVILVPNFNNKVCGDCLLREIWSTFVQCFTYILMILLWVHKHKHTQGLRKHLGLKRLLTSPFAIIKKVFPSSPSRIIYSPFSKQSCGDRKSVTLLST